MTKMVSSLDNRIDLLNNSNEPIYIKSSHPLDSRTLSLTFLELMQIVQERFILDSFNIELSIYLVCQ
jgi:hypothetical protein